MSFLGNSLRANHITYRVLTLPVSPLASGNPSWIMRQFFNRQIDCKSSLGRQLACPATTLLAIFSFPPRLSLFLWSSGSCRSINHRQSLCPPSHDLAQLQRSLCSVGDGRPTVKKVEPLNHVESTNLFEYLSPESCSILQHYCDRN